MPKKTMEYAARIQIKLGKGMKRHLIALCKRNGYGVSELLRGYIEKQIAKDRKKNAVSHRVRDGEETQPGETFPLKLPESENASSLKDTDAV